MSNLFNNDDLDNVVINADETGLVAQEHEIVEAEIEEGLEGKLPDGDDSGQHHT